MRIMTLLASRRPLLSGGSRFAAAAILLGMVLAGSCGGGGDTPVQEFFSGSDQVIRRLVPEARTFKLRLFSIDQQFTAHVDFIVSTALEGEPRMHVISDEDAVAGADLVDEYEGFSIYLKETTYWAELVDEPLPLYAGTPNEEGLKAYVDFYGSGEPELRDQRFWNGFDYAKQRVGRALDEAASLLVVDFDGEWKAEAGGIRIEVSLSTRQPQVWVLYGREDTQEDGDGFDGELVAAFKQRFAVPGEAEEQPENPDWDYAHRIWFVDTEPSGAEQ